jgi:hypothetical protein
MGVNELKRISERGKESVAWDDSFACWESCSSEILENVAWSVLCYINVQKHL